MTHRGIEETARLVRGREVSPVRLVQECLERIRARPELNAFIAVMEASALEEARAAEREIASGAHRGPLHGIPVSVKDLIDVAGLDTTSGSRVPPRRAAADAAIVTRLRDAGAIVIGKTNLHEFAYGTTSDESGFGAVRHPLDGRRSAGGSSAGAAVALVEGMCYGSIGTDTGGSIRIPSAACGIVGLKPTYGELPCDGIVPLSTTFDHVGPMGRTVRDTALLFEALGGDVVASSETRPLTFGVPEPYFCERLSDDTRRALARCRRALEDAGHEVRSVRIEDAEWVPHVYLHIMLPEASQYHAPTLESCAELYSPGVRLRLELGRYVRAEDYVRAMRLRDILVRRVDAALDGVDALLLPTLPMTAPPLGAATVDLGGVEEPVRAAMLRLTQLFNITGHPALAIPAGAGADGFPLSMQLVGRRHGTGALLAAGAAVEPYMTTGPGSVGGGTG